MIKHFSKLLFGLFFIFLVDELIAQVYPVQGSASLIPPYALRLSDYQTSVNEKFVLNAFLADVSKPELHVRFRIRIEGQNVKLETKPEYIGSMITMTGGVPLRLSNIELAEYFDPNHLNFSGISKNDFLKTGFLPEGFYQFCFEVLEYNRGVKISNTICAPAWLILNDPPIINLPLSGSKLKPLSPQNVIFQWTPRHTGSPNAAFSTEYDVKVVEVWPANRNPNDAILTQPSIYETTTNSTTLIYGPEATQLEPGRTYAFRVQARAIAGADHFDLFKNNGYSETVTFIYGDACDAPINIVAEASTPSRVSLQWDASPSQTGYTVQYRVKGQTDGHWYSNSSVISSTEIAGLQPGTTYEYQVMSTCGSFESQYGNIASIATPDLSQGGYTCGVPLENFNLDPSQLIPVLKVGEVIKTGDFDVTITKITGGNGVFSGAGDVVVPFLNQVKAHVIFDNITVNNDKRMVKGYMNVTGGGLEVVPTGVMDQLSQSLSVADSILALARKYFAPPPDPSSFVPDEVIPVPAGIKSVIKDPTTGSVIVIDNNGQTQTIPLGKNVAITDGKGNGVIVGKNGGKADVSDPKLAAILKREYNLSLTFSKAPNTNYGLDAKKLELLKDNYEKLSDNYYVTWKAVSTTPDAVAAIYNGKEDIADKIKFELDGIPAAATANGNSFITNMGSSPSQTPSSLVAKMIPADTSKKEQILGKLNVISYDAKPMNLKIVRVNNAKLDVDASTLKNQLDTIYSKAVVSWNVEVVEQKLQVSGLADPFDDGSSGLLSNYTSDMKTVINSYGTLDPDTYYLFLIDKPASGTKLGYMPRGKKVGFIFTEPNAQSLSPNTLITTMAHELGHGAFTLKHTFVEYALLQKGTTDNLMDYSNNTNLWKYQWDRIHDPAVVLGLFEGDDAGASFSVPCVGIFDDCSDVVAMLKAIKSNVAKNTTQFPSLPIFKPDQEKNRKALYQGNYLSIDGTDYSKIMIRNEAAKDDVIDPKVYNNYYEGGKDKFASGFVFKLSDNSTFKVLVADEKDSTTTQNKVESLRKYLFGNIRPASSTPISSCSSGFCCTKCGRDLTITHERLQEIFPQSTLVSQNEEYAAIFNSALKDAGFNTCDRQAKLFAQIGHESAGFNSQVEGQYSNGVEMDWSITYILTYFKRTSGAKKHFFNQNFWDSKAYKEIITSDYFETVTVSGTHKSQNNQDYFGVYNDQNQSQYHISLPIDFKSDATGLFIKYIVPTSNKDQYRKNMFVQAYDGVLGNVLISVDPATEDGWKYRGRGAIQLTGKSNYQTNKNLIAERFKEVFDFVSTPDLLATNKRATVLSAVAFVLQNLSKIDDIDVMTIDQFSALVNTGNSNNSISNVNGADDRRARYNKLIQDVNLFKCDK